MTTATLRRARILWHYLGDSAACAACDVVVLCCSYDLRVCDHACALIKDGLAPRLLITGKTGNWTRHLWDRPEAHVFADRAIANGLPERAILIEDQATNFGENIALARRLVPDARAVTFVTKPNSVLRVRLTVPIQWPELAAVVDAPSIGFPAAVSNVVGILGLIEEMVGDIHRILEYPKRGFQVGRDVPDDVLDAWRGLIADGFTAHLLPDAPP
jgi:hypothetical protein